MRRSFPRNLLVSRVGRRAGVGSLPCFGTPVSAAPATTASMRWCSATYSNLKTKLNSTSTPKEALPVLMSMLRHAPKEDRVAVNDMLGRAALHVGDNELAQTAYHDAIKAVRGDPARQEEWLSAVNGKAAALICLGRNEDTSALYDDTAAELLKRGEIKQSAICMQRSAEALQRIDRLLASRRFLGAIDLYRPLLFVEGPAPPAGEQQEAPRTDWIIAVRLTDCLNGAARAIGTVVKVDDAEDDTVRDLLNESIAFLALADGETRAPPSREALSCFWETMANAADAARTARHAPAATKAIEVLERAVETSVPSEDTADRVREALCDSHMFLVREVLADSKATNEELMGAARRTTEVRKLHPDVRMRIMAGLSKARCHLTIAQKRGPEMMMHIECAKPLLDRRSGEECVFPEGTYEQFCGEAKSFMRMGHELALLERDVTDDRRERRRIEADLRIIVGQAARLGGSIDDADEILRSLDSWTM